MPLWPFPAAMSGVLDSCTLLDNGTAIVLRRFYNSWNPGEEFQAEVTAVNNVLVRNGRGIEVGNPCGGSDGCVGIVNVTNNTLVDTAEIGVAADTAAWIESNIFSGTGTYAVYDETSDPVIAFNDFWQNGVGDWLRGRAVGAGNLFVDPGFVDAAADDDHLVDASPCIDAGFTSRTARVTDRDGNPGRTDGDGDTFADVDMGAYEHPGPLSPYEVLQSDFTTLDPLTPRKSDVFPFGPTAAVVLQPFASGDFLYVYGPALSCFQVSPDPGRKLLLAREDGGMRLFLPR